MVNYEKMYHVLVGRVDDALQYMLANLHDSSRMPEAAHILQEALREAEERHIEDSL